MKNIALVVVLAAASVLEGHKLYHLRPGKVAQMQVDGDDTGFATNCGSVPFNFSWTPKVLDPSGKVTLTVDYTAPHDFDGGFLNASIYFHGDSEPFIGYADTVKCDDVQSYFPCPIKKGLHVRKAKTIYDLHKLATFPGTYDATAQLYNKQHQEMICINITLTIRSSFQ